MLYLATVFSIGGFVAGLRLGASAIAALLHDVLVLLGAFAIFGYFLSWEIDSLFVTAMLTVIGFSVHDTVVIFDRVRENLRHKARGEAFEPLVNRSINQTLARSLNTSLTVMMTLLALVILGGQTTRLLNVALLDRHHQRDVLVHLQRGVHSGGLGELAGQAPERAQRRPALAAASNGARHGRRPTAAANGAAPGLSRRATTPVPAVPRPQATFSRRHGGRRRRTARFARRRSGPRGGSEASSSRPTPPSAGTPPQRVWRSARGQQDTGSCTVP